MTGTGATSKRKQNRHLAPGIGIANTHTNTHTITYASLSLYLSLISILSICFLLASSFSLIALFPSLELDGKTVRLISGAHVLQGFFPTPSRALSSQCSRPRMPKPEDVETFYTLGHDKLNLRMLRSQRTTWRTQGLWPTGAKPKPFASPMAPTDTRNTN